jgi:hypothetical protein
MILLISPDDWFWYVFGTVAGIGLAVLLVLFIASAMGFEWDSKTDKKDDK